jgi:DNA-binding GntR family transcriptional regulator
MLQLPEIDRDSRTPPYRQVAAHITDAVRRGAYAPGDRLPSMVDLVQHYGIARYTAQKALHALADAGYAELEPGMGFYVPARLPGGHSGGT